MTATTTAVIAKGSNAIILIVIFSGISSFKNDTIITKERYTPPAVATKFCMAVEKGDALGSTLGILSKDIRKSQTRIQTDPIIIKTTNTKVAHVYKIAPPQPASTKCIWHLRRSYEKSSSCPIDPYSQSPLNEQFLHNHDLFLNIYKKFLELAEFPL